jgi:maleate isomerase
VRGAADDAALKNRLEVRTRGIPVVIPCEAAALALASLGVTKLALINPPWFSAELSQKGAGYFQGKGFEVVHHIVTGYSGIDRGAERTDRRGRAMSAFTKIAD